MNNNVELCLYLSIVGPAGIYASETWKTSNKISTNRGAGT